MSLFQSNLRKQIRILPKILNFVKKIHYFSELFTSLLRRRRPEPARRGAVRPHRDARLAGERPHDVFQRAVTERGTRGGHAG